jgi:hypothetical protein
MSNMAQPSVQILITGKYLSGNKVNCRVATYSATPVTPELLQPLQLLLNLL